MRRLFLRLTIAAGLGEVDFFLRPARPSVKVRLDGPLQVRKAHPETEAPREADPAPGSSSERERN
jgi:hypothetical protein